ncbi:hypothetical protein IW262DRAFT_1457880 [Armillaria fumosa]|nr:hypothetical protein IW262DRAFT_1457880 [Armillaria fumosa]
MPILKPRNILEHERLTIILRHRFPLLQRRLCNEAWPQGQPVALLYALKGDTHNHYDHFYTTSVQEMENAIVQYQYSPEGDACFVYDFQAPGTVPLYRLHLGTPADHFYTIDANERNNSIQNLGYKDEGIAAYIYPFEVAGTVPWYRLYNPTAVQHFYTVDVNERIAVSRGGYVDEGIAGYVFPLQ